MKRNSTALAAIGAFSIAMWAATSAHAHCGKGGHGSASKDIVETAEAVGDFETLVTAVEAAGLVETLKSEGPFTVFAPTDEAFGKLPKGMINALLADPERLGAILKYHVVAGRVMAKDVVNTSSAKTALGQSLAISASGGVRVDDANVIKTDIETSNGVIHVIDTVLIPANDIVEAARSAGSFKTLLAALDAADLTDALRGAGPLTVFAPTDEAFDKLPEGTVEALLTDIPKLQSILTYHVVAGEILARDVVKLDEAKTLHGQVVRIDTSSGVKINTARVVKADVAAENGVIHVIDEVLLPPSSKQGNAAWPARELIEHAIHRGVPLYNAGHHAACTAVYEVAAMGLLASAGGEMGCTARDTLESALAAIRQSHDARQNAWILRHALDEVYASAVSN
ncbi:MAG: fasciclin domain-containing protein [Phycisphaerae bacterium]|jgi:uncharacterized surface protein with fasciclin (FAS1) repeats